MTKNVRTETQILKVITQFMLRQHDIIVSESFMVSDLVLNSEVQNTTIKGSVGSNDVEQSGVAIVIFLYNSQGSNGLSTLYRTFRSISVLIFIVFLKYSLNFCVRYKQKVQILIHGLSVKSIIQSCFVILRYRILYQILQYKKRLELNIPFF